MRIILDHQPDRPGNVLRGCELLNTRSNESKGDEGDCFQCRLDQVGTTPTGTTLQADTIELRRSGTACGSSTRAPAVVSASELFSHDLREDALVERQIRYQALQTSILVPQLPQLFDLRHPILP